MAIPDLNALLAEEPLDLAGYQVDLPNELQVYLFDKTKPSYWVQRYYDDVHYFPGLYEDQITNSRELAYQTFLNRRLDWHPLLPLPVVKVALMRFDPQNHAIVMIDSRYN
jgi:hypothetical protein